VQTAINSLNLTNRTHHTLTTTREHIRYNKKEEEEGEGEIEQILGTMRKRKKRVRERKGVDISGKEILQFDLHKDNNCIYFHDYCS